MPLAVQRIEFHNIFQRIRMHGAAMDWDRISGNWAHWRERIRERWGRLTSDELDGIAGRREQLVGRIQSAYGIEKTEAERQLRTFQRNLEVEVDSEVNGRG